MGIRFPGIFLRIILKSFGSHVKPVTMIFKRVPIILDYTVLIVPVSYYVMI
jgi:hypothetical protein